jgi:hypothetical protein
MEKKVWYIYTIEYYSVLKKNGIMPFAGKWMKISQVRKDKHCMFSHMQSLYIFFLNDMKVGGRVGGAREQRGMDKYDGSTEFARTKTS